MAQQRRVAGEVRHVAEDLAPVAHVEHRPRDVAAQLRALLGRSGQRRPDRDEEDHGEERRQEPLGSTHPEPAERDTAVAVVFLEQQRRDQEPGHDEEHLDAEEPAVHPREPGVVQQHDDDRQGPQPVERRLVSHPLRDSVGGAAATIRVDVRTDPAPDTVDGVDVVRVGTTGHRIPEAGCR